MLLNRVVAGYAGSSVGRMLYRSKGVGADAVQVMINGLKNG